jgi:hypothetical protein
MVWVYENRRNWGVVLAKQKADKTTLAKPEIERGVDARFQSRPNSDSLAWSGIGDCHGSRLSGSPKLHSVHRFVFSPCLCPSLDKSDHFETSQSAVANMSTTTTVTQPPQITAENILRLFPQINTSLANAVSATQDNDLEGYDEEQIRLMDEVCIVLDENDLPIGSASKKVCTYYS